MLTTIALLSSLIACTPSADKEAQESLKAYTLFVDSVYAQNEVWKSTPDTDFVEYPIDPNDPTVTRLDTIVTAPEAKGKSMVLDNYWGKQIMKDYDKVKTNAESKSNKMDEKMKKEYEASKQKFESLLTP